MLTLARLAPLALVVGCAETMEVSPDENAATDGYDFQEVAPSDETLGIEFFFVNSNCDVAGWDLETSVTRSDGSFVENAECRFVFDDGASADFCIGFVELTPGEREFQLVVRDPATGATGTLEGRRPVDQPLDLTLDARAGCLSISWTGTVTPPTFRMLTITPPENVLAEQPLPMSGEVAVTTPGVYEVSLFAEDERSTGPICSERVSRTITVEDCPEPTPPCELDHEHATE